MSDTQPTERIPAPHDGSQPTRLLPAQRRPFPWWPVLAGVLGLALVGAIVALVVALNRPAAPVAVPTSSTATPE
ncbi:MAG TPA: hypothetical protein VN200_01870, partial [Rhodoglobus sp.]|nr:hypothetical protein [Rhodoglobus sp.]